MYLNASDENIACILIKVKAKQHTGRWSLGSLETILEAFPVRNMCFGHGCGSPPIGEEKPRRYVHNKGDEFVGRDRLVDEKVAIAKQSLLGLAWLSWKGYPGRDNTI